ncbi:MAG: hypothetical protein U0835_19265 [Isosphaeraceae bacterium]
MWGPRGITSAPWTSVYKIHLLTDADLTFVLTEGGHNAGIPLRASATRTATTRWPRARTARPTRPPRNGSARPPTYEGSWWPAWEHWLSERSSGRVPAVAPGAPERGYPPLDDAPGQYVLMT